VLNSIHQARNRIGAHLAGLPAARIRYFHCSIGGVLRMQAAHRHTGTD
jgi:hypothetical protein